VNEVNIDLLVVYDYRKWINFNATIGIPNGMIQTISKFEDLRKIQKANTLIVNREINYPSQEYIKDSEPQPVGLGTSDYLYTFWKGK